MRYRISLSGRSPESRGRRRGAARLLIGAMVLSLLFLGMTTKICAETDEEANRRFAEGLRQRRLFELGVDLCRRELAGSGISEPHRANMTIELLRLLADQAMHLPAPKRPPLWQQAGTIAREFARSHRSNPRVYLVMTQEALTALANGELVRQEWEVHGQASLLEAAKQRLRTAASLLNTLADELKRVIPQAEAVPRSPAILSSGELTSLRHSVLYHLGTTYRNQALCYPAQSNDRVNSLRRAVNQLAQPLTQLASDDPLRTQIHIEIGICYRLAGDLNKAAQALAMADRAKPEPADKLRIRAEHMRLALSIGRLSQAKARLLEPREIDGVSSPELDFAHLQTILSLWRKAEADRQANDAKAWQQRATAVVALIEQTHGAYWGRRANALLVRIAGAGRGAGNMDILRRTANEHFLKAEYESAIRAYDKAAQFALANGNADESFRMRCTAAEVEVRRKDLPAYLRRWRKACRDLKQVRAAPGEHLRACRLAHQLATGDAKYRPVYEEMLREHLILWPQDASCNDVRARLGLQRQAEGKYSDALSYYRQVTVDFDKFDSLLQAVDQCVQAQLAALDSNSVAFRSALADALKHYDQVVLRGGPRLPERWTPSARSAAVAASQLRLAHRADQVDLATRMLRSALSDRSHADAAWSSSARSLLVVLLARQGQTNEAMQILKQLANGSNADLLATLYGLGKMKSSTDAGARRQIGQLQLSLADQLLAANAVKADALPAVRNYRAQALADLGRIQEAVAEYEKLVKAYPRNLSIQMGYADALMSDDRAQSRTTAIQRWRLLKRVTRRGSESWFRANYSLALTHYKSGNRKRAAQLIRLLKATSDISNSGYRARIEQLLKDSGG